MSVEMQSEQSPLESQDLTMNLDSSEVNSVNEGDDQNNSAAAAESAEAKIFALEDELNESKDRYMRTLADMENMRRRHERERSELLKYGTEKLLQDVLPVLDSFEKAVSSVGPNDQGPIVDGVKMVHKQFLQILENHGLKQIEAVGQPFDPNVHQAIQRIESEEINAEIVKDEYQKGYTLNGRLVRPSMVSVCVPKSS